MAASSRDVRFSLKSEHQLNALGCPLCAISRHTQPQSQLGRVDIQLDFSGLSDHLRKALFVLSGEARVYMIASSDRISCSGSTTPTMLVPLPDMLGIVWRAKAKPVENIKGKTPLVDQPPKQPRLLGAS